MKKTKKFLSILLSVLMIISAMPFSAVTALANDDFVISEEGVLIAYNGAGGEVVIPDGVIAIGDGVFEMNKTITSVEISNTVTTIGRYAFSACSNLKTVVISKSVTSIEYGAFSGCGAILNFTISDNVSNCEFDMRNLWLKADPLELTIYYYCDSDLDTIKQIIPPFAGGDSNYQVTHDYLDATCIEPRKCSVCDFVSDTSYGEHNWVEATCTEDGYCSVCHAVGEPAHGHSFTEIGERIRFSCTEFELYREKCAYCGLEGEIVEGKPPLKHDQHILLSVENNVYSYVCTYEFCGMSYTVDTNALISAVATAKEEYINSGVADKKYNNYEALITAVTNGSNMLSRMSNELGFNASEDEPLQEDIDNATNAILDAINNLEFKTYSVTVNKIVDDAIVDAETVKIAYGEMFNYFVDLAENQAIYKWVMETDERDVKLNTITQELSQVINGNVTFNCYIDNTDTKAEDTARVVFYDKGNRVIGLEYVTIGSSISYNVEAPKVAFYTFTGWEVVSGDPTNVDKSGVSLRAIYAPKSNTCKIIGLNGVTVNGKTEFDAYYDQKLTLAGAESFAYCDADGNILQGINGNVIYAPNNEQTIYVCAGTSDEASTAITGYIDENSKLTINAQYYLPSGSSVVEAGVIATNGDKSNTFKSSQQGSSGEYSISLNYGSASGTLNFKSYLNYKDSEGKLQTIYSESQAISFGQNA